MKVFITGGAGFIGSHLAAHLLQQGHAVTAYDNLLLGKREWLAPLENHPSFRFLHRDLLNDPELKKALSGHDLVFHLAANSDISLGSTRTDLDLQYGVMATYNLLEAMRETGGPRQLIFSSSSAIYGEASLKPTPENYGPLLPISFYGASKLSAEAMICAFAHHYGIRSWLYRFANVVGAHLTHGAIYDFVQRLKKSPHQLEVLGNGRQRKSYLHVSDCIEGMLYGHQHSQNEVNIFNLSSQGVSEVRFIAEEVVRQVAPKAKIIYGQEDRGWKGDVPFTWLSPTQLGTLGWTARQASDEAVRTAIREVVECSRKP